MMLGYVVMRNRLDITGHIFGRLTAIKSTGQIATSGYLWECQCTCGNTVTIAISTLRRGSTKSCGCLRKEMGIENKTTHGMSKTREHNIWVKMVQRCTNPNDVGYKNYGGRGIQVCDRWHNSFEAFYADMGPSNGLSIDRRDNDGNYEPGNCRWTNMSIQNLNKRIPHCNTTGTKGVSYNSKTGRYQAKLKINGEDVLAKTFPTIEEAIEARLKAEDKFRKPYLDNQ